MPAYTSAESRASAFSGLLLAARSSQREVASSAERQVDISDFSAGSLDEAQAKALFTRFGIPAVAERIVETSAEAESAARELGGKVVLKVLSGEITHKSGVGGVAINLTPDTIGGRLITMANDVEKATGERPRRFLAQEMVAGGTELILGMYRDALGMASSCYPCSPTGRSRVSGNERKLQSLPRSRSRVGKPLLRADDRRRAVSTPGLSHHSIRHGEGPRRVWRLARQNQANLFTDEEELGGVYFFTGMDRV